MIKVMTLILLLMSLSVKANTGPQSNIDEQLIQFARANCLYQYFQHKNYDLGDIRNISAGIVQMSSISPDTFVEVSKLVKKYEPAINYKNETSPLLAKCFTLENDPVFLENLSLLTQVE